MNGYIAYYNGKKAEIIAKDLYGAKMKAIAVLGAGMKNYSKVAIMLAEIDGKPVIHNPAILD